MGNLNKFEVPACGMRFAYCLATFTTKLTNTAFNTSFCMCLFWLQILTSKS